MDDGGGPVGLVELVGGADETGSRPVTGCGRHAAGRVIVINDIKIVIVAVGACVWPLTGAQGISVLGGDTLFEDSVPFGCFRSF